MDLGVGLVVVIPSRAPRQVLGIDQIMSTDGLDVGVNKNEIGSVVMTIGRPLAVGL